VDSSLSIVELEYPSDSCTYLPNERQNLTYRVTFSLPADQYVELLRRGWRRQGIYFFRPTCPSCRKCRSLRVQLANFRPTKSQRRAIRRNQDVEVRVAKTVVDDEHIDLFNRYHADMQQRRGWNYEAVTAEDYFESFISGRFTFAREMSFWRDGKLIGVSLIDILADESSSIYFYHDPSWRSLGPGTFSMLCELEHMRSLGLKYHYLGYWIRECRSMEYKSRFGPHELLDEYVSDEQEPSWSRAE